MKTAEENFLKDCLLELDRARKKFPSANHSLIALMEEVGEFAQARLKCAAGKDETENLFKEGMQVVTMVLRVLFENDESFMLTDYTEPK